MSYLIDFTYFITYTLPTMLRNVRMLNWLTALLKPLATYNQRIVSDLIFNGEISSLERKLNDTYGIEYLINERDDQITAGEIIYIKQFYIEPFYKHNKAEQFEDVYFSNIAENEDEVYLHNFDDIGALYEFIIFIPVSITFNEPFVRALVNRYIQSGKSFLIQTY